MIGIYKITSPTKRVYIGQSINIEKRISNYRGLHCKKQPIIYRSFIKYGFEKHKIEILCQCEISELNDKERYYQDLYSAIGVNGMNCKLTKTNDRSGYASEETKKKQSIGNKGKTLGRKQPASQIEKRIKSLTGLKRSEDHKLHSRMIKLGKLNPMFGKKIKESSKQLQRDKLSGELNYLTKIILNIETGVFYYGLSEASNSCNMSKSFIWQNVYKNKINKTNFIYV